MGRCTRLASRLPPNVDPTLNSTFRNTLMRECRFPNLQFTTQVPMDHVTPLVFDNQVWLNSTVLYCTALMCFLFFLTLARTVLLLHSACLYNGTAPYSSDCTMSDNSTVLDCCALGCEKRISVVTATTEARRVMIFFFTVQYCVVLCAVCMIPSGCLDYVSSTSLLCSHLVFLAPYACITEEAILFLFLALCALPPDACSTTSTC